MTKSSTPGRASALKGLIQSPALEFLLEAHNGLSARIVEEAGFKGIWASGLSIAASLGVRDANEASWTQVIEVAEFMADAVEIPILLDGDTGYGDFNSVRRLVRKLSQRRIAGVCLEDKCFPKQNSFIRGSRQPLASVEEFVGKIKAAKDAPADSDFCVVARVEALIAGWGHDEALLRANAYADAGADAILIHSARSEPGEILAFQREFQSRIPVIIVPTKYYTTPTEVFREAGVSMAIWANHMMRAALQSMQKLAARIHAEENLLSAEAQVAPMSEVFRLQGESELEEAEKRYLPGSKHQAKGVILAASRGHELGELTADRPKCMLPLGGRAVIKRIVETYRQAGIRDVAVVRGYCKQMVVLDGVEFFDNDAYATTQEVGSLLAARAALKGALVLSYGDVLFQRHVIDALCAVTDDFVIAVDPAWRLSKNVQGRPADLVQASRPSSRQSFLVKTTLLTFPTSSVEAAQRQATGPKIDGEWIGVMKTSATGTVRLLQTLDALAAKGVNVLQLRLPEVLAELIANGQEIRVIYNSGAWIDVDSVDDLYLDDDF